ncbi:MAG: hypothetical protein ACRDQZ_14830 [Mycobacteriales bacterium]
MRQTSRSLTAFCEKNYLAELREDWPHDFSLHAETGLKLPGCCVLLAAEQIAAAAVATFDDRLAAADRAGFAVLRSRS